MLLFVPYPLYALPVGRKVGWFFLMPDNRGMCRQLCLLMFGYLSVGPGRDKGKGVIWIKGVRCEFSPIMILLPYLAHFALAFSFALMHSSVKIVSLSCDYSLLLPISPSHHLFPSLRSVTTTFHFFCRGYMTGWLRVVSAWAMLLGQPDSGMQDQELIVGC